MGLTKEFKEFAMRGNVIDLAVGIIIGAAFGKIVSSIVADIIMPPIGLLLGGVNFTDLKLIIKDAVPAQLDVAGNVISEMAPAVSINYGNFLQVAIDFLIIAFAIFMMVKAINATKKKEKVAAAPPPAPSKEETLLTEIRDILKNK